MIAKNIKQHSSSISNRLAVSSPAHKLPLSANSCTSFSENYSNFKTVNQMSKSLKPKILHNEAGSQQNIQKQGRQRDKLFKQKSVKIKAHSNSSVNKSKKISDSYYFGNQKRNKQPQIGPTSIKFKQSTKTYSHQLVDLKQTKSKQAGSKKLQKSKNQFNTGHTSSKLPESLNYNSLKRLICSLQLSEQSPSHKNKDSNMTKFRTVRTFSPEVEFISEQLQHRKKDKRILRKQQQLLQRMAHVLQEYRSMIAKQIKQKDTLIKQNRKLKDKLHVLNSEKKYKTVLDYHA